MRSTAWCYGWGTDSTWGVFLCSKAKAAIAGFNFLCQKFLFSFSRQAVKAVIDKQHQFVMWDLQLLRSRPIIVAHSVRVLWAWFGAEICWRICVWGVLCLSFGSYMSCCPFRRTLFSCWSSFSYLSGKRAKSTPAFSTLFCFFKHTHTCPATCRAPNRVLLWTLCGSEHMPHVASELYRYLQL